MLGSALAGFRPPLVLSHHIPSFTQSPPGTLQVCVWLWWAEDWDK